MATRVFQARTSNSHVIGLLAGAMLAVAVLAIMALGGASDRAAADGGNGLYTCGSGDPWPGSAPGELRRYNLQGYVWYGTFCGGGRLVKDIQGNPIPSDVTAPGVILRDSGAVGVYEGDRVLTPYCVKHPSGAATDAGCRHPREPGDTTAMRFALRATTSTTPAPFSDGSGEIVYQADGDNRVVLAGGNYYREIRRNGRWKRSISYGSDDTARRAASWNAHYASRSVALVIPPNLHKAEDPPAGTPITKANPSGSSGPAGQGAPSGQGSTNQGSSTGDDRSTSPATCEELYAHLPPSMAGLICNEI
jgi:hypothetical protein